MNCNEKPKLMKLATNGNCPSSSVKTTEPENWFKNFTAKCNLFFFSRTLRALPDLSIVSSMSTSIGALTFDKLCQLCFSVSELLQPHLP